MRLTLLVLCAFAVLMFAAWRFQVKSAPSPKTFQTTQDFIDFLSAEAVKDAETESHVRLDYTVDSIRKVEDILGGLHDQYAKNPSSIAAKGLATAYGAYIGEVIRKTDPNAKWEKGDAVGGEKSYPLIWGAGTSYPMAWCYHRIVNGAEDNVWIKYRVLKEHASRSQPKP